jgi:hypothetical protein
MYCGEENQNNENDSLQRETSAVVLASVREKFFLREDLIAKGNGPGNVRVRQQLRPTTLAAAISLNEPERADDWFEMGHVLLLFWRAAHLWLILCDCG